jgi:isopentenyl-diphosphate delta-isomerase
MAKVAATPQRKADHIRVNLEQDVQSGLATGLDALAFTHRALPELDLTDVDVGLSFLGHPLRAPLLISSMTGGTEQASQINRRLALAAQTQGVALGVGSQRAAIEDPSLAPTFQVRVAAPDVLLLANLGAVQLNYGYDASHCQRAVDMIGADALILHLNPLQEALQPEGDNRFGGLLKRIEAVCHALRIPVIAKEVGWGISAQDARQLVEAGVAAIDVAGAGGTSWSQVEMHRASTEHQRRLAASFLSWGIPTADAVRQVRQALPHVPLIASGGLRSGLDIAKCLALGADLGAMAGPFLKAAAESEQAAIEAVALAIDELRLSMFATGSANLPALRQAPLSPTP